MISIVIPALNEEKYIGVLLECIKNQTWKDYEILVADADSKDKTREIAKKYGAKIVPGGRQSVGRNSGAKHSKGEIIVFLDADITFDTNFLGNCYQSFISRKLDIACCYFETYPLSLKMKMIYALWNSSKYLRRKSKKPDGEGQCTWVRKSVFEKLGGYNEKLRIAEDIDLVQRAVSRGYCFDILNYRFLPSTRRYERVGIIRVFFGSFIAGAFQILGMIRENRISQSIYGGWGEYEVKE